ncbi:Xaa-Pro peptidase family protein [Candidatus Woesearchaeota archaeon]|nr:Xaa-Pro peptidase family protein [Candidatus Woesearchaeota archaeon]
MRLKEFQKEMRKNRIGLALFFSLDGDNVDPNLVYLSQYTGFGALAVTPNKAVLVVPKAEHVRAKRTSKVRVAVAEKRLLPAIRKAIKGRPKRIGIDKNRISLNFYKALRKELRGRYVDVSGMCLRLRTVKTTEEIRIIRKACALADEIMQKTFWKFKRFKTEAEVAAFMRSHVYRKGLKLAFPPVVASGKNACEAHHDPDSKRLQKGFCVIDFGVKYKGYCSDMTRTIYIGTPTRKELEMYYKVLDVQIRLIDMCSVGKSFIWINKKAHELFGKDSPYFTHLIGHGIGTEIHESPNPKVTPRRPVTKLLENSVITIEPGLYHENKSGIRIEDDILITDSGPKVLTKTGKNLLIIKKK